MEEHIEGISDLPKVSLEWRLFKVCAKILTFYCEGDQTLEQVVQRTSSLEVART